MRLAPFCTLPFVSLIGIPSRQIAGISYGYVSHGAAGKSPVVISANLRNHVVAAIRATQRNLQRKK